MKNFNKLNNTFGQVMVEAMVAMSVIVVGLLGAFALSSGSVSLSRVAGDRYIAVNLANEGIELVKNLIDNNNWGVIPGFDASGSYEMDYNDLALKHLGFDGSGERSIYFSKSSGYYAYKDVGLDEAVYAVSIQNFKRLIDIQSYGDYVKVTSTVSWNAKDGPRLIFSVDSYFYKLDFL